MVRVVGASPFCVVTLVGAQQSSHECCLVFARDVGEEGVTNEEHKEHKEHAEHEEHVSRREHERTRESTREHSTREHEAHERAREGSR